MITTRDELPQITAAEAAERGLWTLHQVADWTGLALATIYNLAGDEGFPPPVAELPSTGPNPHLVRDRAAVKEWAKTRPQPLMGTWTDSAEQITRQKATSAGNVLSLAETCAATALSPETLMDYIRRTITTVRGPMANLMRPAYRVSTTPYWSRQQVDAYFEAKAQDGARRAGLVVGLPEVAQEVADERQWWSIRRLAAWAGLAVVTMHRYANKQGFPGPVAVVPSNGPNPIKVRDRAKVEEWLLENRPNWRPPGDQ